MLSNRSIKPRFGKTKPQFGAHIRAAASVLSDWPATLKLFCGIYTHIHQSGNRARKYNTYPMSIRLYTKNSVSCVGAVMLRSYSNSPFITGSFLFAFTSATSFSGFERH
jgi:hypothetical protein